MMTTIFLVRHGETLWHADHRYAGWADVALNDRGREQSQQLALWAATTGLDAIHTSTLSRAIDTATPSSEATGLPIVTSDDLREVGFGVGEGKTLDELRPKYAEAVASFVAAPAEAMLPGGERGLDGIVRYRAALDQIVAEYPNGRVLVVAHGTAIRLVLSSYLGIDPNRYREVFPAVDNCALTEITLGDDRFALRRYNAAAAA